LMISSLTRLILSVIPEDMRTSPGKWDNPRRFAQNFQRGSLLVPVSVEHHSPVSMCPQYFEDLRVLGDGVFWHARFSSADSSKALASSGI
jgi:hypothetical protein